MQLGMVGLGRMGGNLVRRLMRGGHTCAVHDRDAKVVEALAAGGATGAASLEALVGKLDRPRVVWLMLPAGEVTERAVEAAGACLDAGDVVIDGGNTFFKDDVRRARKLRERDIHYVDVGTSGGVWGLERGYCLMIGGDAEVVRRLGPIWQTLAPGRAAAGLTPEREGKANTADEGWLHCGPNGAGHFVKMVHNGIEYGLMQAYAEGFDLMREAGAEGLAEGTRYQINVADVAELWRRGSVVGSWLLDLTAKALAADPALDGFTGAVPDSGEGRWTVLAALDEAVAVPTLAGAVFARFRSRRDHTFGEKLLSAMRQQFGGHAEANGKGGGHG